MREKRVYAHLVLRFLESIFCFAVLKADRIVAPNFHHAKRIAVLRDPETNREIVAGIETNT